MSSRAPKVALWLLAMGANLVWNLSKGLLFTLIFLVSLPDMSQGTAPGIVSSITQGTGKLNHTYFYRNENACKGKENHSTGPFFTKCKLPLKGAVTVELCPMFKKSVYLKTEKIALAPKSWKM